MFFFIEQNGFPDENGRLVIDHNGFPDENGRPRPAVEQDRYPTSEDYYPYHDDTGAYYHYNDNTGPYYDFSGSGSHMIPSK